MRPSMQEWIRRKGKAVALILAPLVYMIGQALQQDIDTSDAAEQLPVLIEHQSRGVAAMVICILGVILFIPATLELMRLLRGRGARLTLISDSLAVAGVPDRSRGNG